MGLFSSKAGKASIAFGKDNLKIIGWGHENNVNQLQERYRGAQGYLNETRDLYRPLQALGEKATNLYSDSLGVNGAEGNARASSAFTTGPGYQFNMDQGLQALERRAAAQGRLQSGQTGIDTLGFAQGLASQEYGGWQDRVAGLGSLWGQGIAGEAGALGDLANNENRLGQNISAANDSFISGILGANKQIAEGYEAQNAAKDAMKGSLLGLGGKLLGSFAGGGAGGLTSLFGYGR